MTLDVVCVGAVTLDRIAVVDRTPGEDERVVAEPFVVAGGGPAATAAVSLARLGASVGFCGVVGNDPAGRLVRRQLVDEGVDVQWLETREGVRTTESMILVSRPTGARTIITTPSIAPESTAVPIAASTWLHVDQTGYRPVREALDGLAGAGPLLSIDGGNPIDGLDLVGVQLYAPTVSALREVVPSESLAESMRAAAALVPHVVSTNGSAGSHVLEHSEVVTVSPFAIQAVSTMGAGDVFHGALLAGIIAGRDLADAARWANAVAALSCRTLDGRSGIPTARQTQAFIAEATASAHGQNRTE